MATLFTIEKIQSIEDTARRHRAQDLMDKAQKYLKEEYNSWYEMWTDNGAVKVEIEWGDWKHDHGFCDYIFTNLFGAKHETTEVTEEDGSDTYSAIHTYIPKGNE